MSSHNAASLALLVALALLASAACATTAGATGADLRAAGWTEPSENARPGGIPTLINDVGQPRGGAESQLPIGLGLLAVGLLGLVYGLSLLRTTHRRRLPGEMRHVGRAPRRPRTSDTATTLGPP